MATVPAMQAAYPQGGQVQQPQPVIVGQQQQVVQPQVIQQPVVQPMAYQPQVAQAPGAMAYYPQGTPGVAPGGVVMVVPAASTAPNYSYTPKDFLVCSIITAILCGLFSPLSLAMSIPAVIFSCLSQNSARSGNVKQAKQQGMTAAYLNFAAVVSALVVACVCTGLVVGLYGPTYYRNIYCNSYRGYSYSYRYRCY